MLTYLGTSAASVQYRMRIINEDSTYNLLLRFFTLPSMPCNLDKTRGVFPMPGIILVICGEGPSLWCISRTRKYIYMTSCQAHSLDEGALDHALELVGLFRTKGVRYSDSALLSQQTLRFSQTSSDNDYDPINHAW